MKATNAGMAHGKDQPRQSRCPRMGWFSSTAIPSPAPSFRVCTTPTSTSVFQTVARKLGCPRRCA
jgi:hypothetical protein